MMTMEVVNVLAWGLVILAAVLVAISPTGDVPAALTVFTAFSGGGGVLATAAPFVWKIPPTEVTIAAGFTLAGMLICLLPYVRSRRQRRREARIQHAPSRPGRFGG